MVLIASTACASAADDNVSFNYGGILSRSTFGYLGIIEMPSAEMAPDGELSAGISVFKNTERYNFEFQALPWLDFSFRYAIIPHFIISSVKTTDFDRSFGFKIRLSKEGDYTPAVVVGVRDLVGTGIYAAEYISASKHVFDDFDVTIGMGWGRLSTAAAFANPLGKIFPSFNDRASLLNAGLVSQSGQVNFGQLFHGPNVGIFGGVVWQTPIKNLALSAEYSSDRYVEETAFDAFKPRTQFNFGAAYQLFDSTQIGINWLYGTTIGVNLTFAMNPKEPQYPIHIEPDRAPAAIRTSSEQQKALEVLANGGPISRIWNSQRSSTSNTRKLQNQNIQRDRFVDNIISDGSSANNIEMHGTTLTIETSASSETIAKCKTFANLAATFESNLESIALIAIGPRQTKPIKCDVPRVAEASLFTPATWIASNTSSAPPVEPLTTSAAVPEGVVGSIDGPAITEPDNGTIEAKIRSDAAAQNLTIEAVHIAASEALVYYSNERYWDEPDALGRLARILMNDAPPDVEIFRLVSLVHGVPIQEYKIMRAPLERLFAQNADPAEARDAISVNRPARKNPILESQSTFGYPKFSWSVTPEVQESFFDPRNPLQLGVLLGASGTLEVLPGIALNGGLEGNIWNNFSTATPSNSALPHVRSDIEQYYKHGINGIADLYGSYRFRLAPGVFAIAKVGYLESMFAGAGGEILWRPEESRFAFGVDAYEVWQRNFDRLLGFQHYHVLTGHVSVYYESPWYGMNFRLMAGRYLAGDHGVTLEITRRFSTGVEIGAFATKTNVSAQQFGEGAFDKGIIIRIPLEWALPVSTQTEFALDLRPVQRDGGQRLDNDATLFDDTYRDGYGELLTHLNDIVAP